MYFLFRMPRPKKIGPYKKYLRNPNVSIPRSTVWFRQTQQQKDIYNHDDSNSNNDVENNRYNCTGQNVNSDSLDDNISVCASSIEMQVCRYFSKLIFTLNKFL